MSIDDSGRAPDQNGQGHEHEHEHGQEHDPSNTRPRQSTYESADQAAGIYSLYGDGTRDSWRSSGASGHQQGMGVGMVNGRSAPRTPLRNSITGEEMEELANDAEPSHGGGGVDRSSARSSTVAATPDIKITPSKTNGTARNSLGQRVITPTHAHTNTDVSRLSPARHPLGGSTTSAASSASMSQVSFAGSSQYPGEEEDAYHVRSTYARLEAMGVHGDGWDAGVERTRGGPSSKRATMMEPDRESDLTPKEREFLESLDRYGFVNEPLRNRSETRVAFIPLAPLKRIPKLPKESPLKGVPPVQPDMGGPSDHEPRQADTPKRNDSGTGTPVAQRRKEQERVDKWMKMMKVGKRDQGGNVQDWVWRSDGQGAKLAKRVYKGIPDRWRMAAWWTLAEEHSSRTSKGKRKATAEELAIQYTNSIDQPSTFDVQIDLDVPRTISGHTQFVTRYGQGQRSLFHVLHCFSLRCGTCEYVQGMGPIAATLLCYFDPERAYALLCRLHDSYGMHTIFAPGFPGLLEAFYVQERLMEYLMPDVYQSFQRNMISSSAWGTKWYITLFVNTVPFSQQLRIWDALWLDGRDIIVMVSVAILWAFRDLLAAKNATFESILSLLSSYFVAEDEDALMRWIEKTLNQPGMRARLSSWREDWARLKEQGKSDAALL